MGLTPQTVQALWNQIHALDAQLAPYRRAEDDADRQIRAALRDGTHEQILAAYDHRFETRHCHFTLTRHLIEERRWLLAQLPKKSG